MEIEKLLFMSKICGDKFPSHGRIMWKGFPTQLDILSCAKCSFVKSESRACSGHWSVHCSGWAVKAIWCHSDQGRSDGLHSFFIHSCLPSTPSKKLKPSEATISNSKRPRSTRPRKVVAFEHSFEPWRHQYAHSHMGLDIKYPIPFGTSACWQSLWFCILYLV